MKTSKQFSLPKRQEQENHRKSIRNLINFLKKKIFSLFPMDLNSLLGLSSLDTVIRASASTYNPEQLQQRGLQITVNLSNKKVRYLGEATNPVYPDIIIWRPDYPNANTGQAIIVELIENDTFTHGGVPTWIRLANTIGIRFNLIVPNSQLQYARGIINTNTIANIHLQTWDYDVNSGRYIFNTIT